ncbi:RNA-binding KH domain-containing protein RCF3 isoform X2 [Actinidia eriantha]|uniref:RNA-binding KH domain-containing protein RCF3 isoform X2 n=1 Tax=Actinidia eriantha TaxID=165200 RepID=UPI0025838A73|nr:RNA-binding KH domain-containing protein RCF3 isoform X2 [Actinidia eriantha]
MAGRRNSYGKRPHSESDYADNGGNKRRNPGDDRESFSIGREDTVYRYLCPGKKIGSIIGRGGEIVKQLRADSKSKIRIGETVRGCEERVVTIYSSSEETNTFDDTDNLVCPAQDALFRVHDRVVADDLAAGEDLEETPQVTAKFLVPSDQIGCVIGKGGQIVQNIRSETGAQIRILKDDHLPACALSSDELVQISGEPQVVRKALYQIASRLHDNPSRSQHMLASAVPNAYPSGGSLMGPNAGAPIMGLAPLVGSYGGYKGDSRDWSRPFYSAPRGEASSKEFSLRLICPAANIGGVIGKGGTIINQIRQESGAGIKVDSSAVGGDDCIISISAKEFFEDAFSPTIEAALRLQPRCSEKVERDSGLVSFTTRLLVPTSRIGCLIGKGGAIITEMRRITKANIRILSKEDVPKVAAEDEEMVLISGDPDLAKDALMQVTSRLRANLFDREGAVSALVPVLPYLPMSTDGSNGLKYESRDNRRHGRDHSYSDGYSEASDLPAVDDYGSYGGLQSGSNSGGYGAYGGYSSGRADSSMLRRSQLVAGMIAEAS